MAIMEKQARVSIEYADGCFCDRRTFGSIIVDMEPRFNFAQAVKDLAQKECITDVVLNKCSSGRGALGILSEPCRHRTAQTVRFYWNLVY